MFVLKLLTSHVGVLRQTALDLSHYHPQTVLIWNRFTFHAQLLVRRKKVTLAHLI
jgi:hypothetical protein